MSERMRSGEVLPALEPVADFCRRTRRASVPPGTFANQPFESRSRSGQHRQDRIAKPPSTVPNIPACPEPPSTGEGPRVFVVDATAH